MSPSSRRAETWERARDVARALALVALLALVIALLFQASYETAGPRFDVRKLVVARGGVL